MAVDFLTDEQKAKYGRYLSDPDETELARYFHLDETDKEFILKRRGTANQLGFALQLTSVRYLGGFLNDLNNVPPSVLLFVEKQLSINNSEALKEYARRETTKREHKSLIRKQYEYHDFNDAAYSFRLSRLLYTRSWISNERPSLLFDFATSWLLQNKILLPGISTLSRLISEIRERAANRLWKRLSALPTKQQKNELETLLLIPEGERTSGFDRYRKGPVTISSPAFNLAIERFVELRHFGLSDLDFSLIPPVRLKMLARHASLISMYKVSRMPENKRIAILVAFVKAYEVIALDDAMDILDLLITGIAGEAKKIGQKNRLRSLKDLDKSALALASICALILDENTKDEQLREAIYATMPKKAMLESIDTIQAIARPNNTKFHDEMVDQYGKVRRFLPQSLWVLFPAPWGVMFLS